MDRTCVQLALALVCSWSWNNSRQRLVFERNLNPKSGNLLDPFGDEKQNKSDTYIYIYDTYESAAWSKPGGGACLHAPNDASAEG